MRPHSVHRRPLLQAHVLASFALLAGCHAEPPKQAGFGPMPVRVVALAPVVVPEQDEYLASITSRHSVTLYAQVAGVVSAVGSKPGATVHTGDLLIQIDPAQQSATLRSLQAGLETKKANLAFAVQNDESSKGLVKSGLLSELDYEQRHSQRVSAEADTRTTSAQIEAQLDLLRYYRIAAPTDGIVGDIPVKVGDYVTPQTRLTSVDQNNLVEAYVYVPVAKAGAIKPDTTIVLVGDDGKAICEEKPTFVSPQVTIDTQSVLVKTVCPNDGALRSAQVLKARLVWAKRERLTVPTSATTRQAGQYFVFVASPEAHGDAAGTARQVPVQVGPIEGNEFVVLKGLAAGDRVIVSGIQKLHDGAPITVQADGPAPGTSATPEARAK